MKRTFSFLVIFLLSISLLRAAVTSGSCGENLTWTLDTRDSSLVIEGYGIMTGKWYGYDSYVKEITFPENITSINWDAVTACKNLQKITWNTINYDGGMQIEWLGRVIKEVEIGENVTYIPNSLFYKMLQLKSVVCHALVPPSAGAVAFAQTPRSNITLFVPEESIDAYSNAMWWEEFSPIRPIGYYIVKFLDWDSVELSSNYVKEGQSIIAPTLTPREGYTFIGWDKEFNNITEDLIITAQYKKNKYLVRFVDWDGTVLKSDSVEYGNSATAPTPTRVGYSFIGWDKEFSNVTCELTIMANYRINKYLVQFVDWDYTILKSDSIEYGASIVAPSEPSRTGYTFFGWDKEFSNVTCELTIKANYRINKYLVQFVDWDNKILKSDSVEYKKSAVAPENPTREGYRFVSWDKDFSSISNNTVVTALYELIAYPVIFLDYNSTILDEQFVEVNHAAILPDAPYRNGYNFTGWNVNTEHITERTFVIATYEKIETDAILIVFKDELNNIVASNTVSCPIPQAPIREDKQFLGWYIGDSMLEDIIIVRAKYNETGHEDISTPISEKKEVRKEIRNGNFYIIQGEKVYTTTGIQVK